MTDSDDGVSRRSVLRKGAITAGAVAVGTVATSGNAAAAKQGGRAQVDGTVNRNEPWTLSTGPSDISRHASCMATESAEQWYLEYDIEYCNSDDEATMYVIPDEAELAQDQVYEFRASRPCRANDLTMVALGPSDDECE